VKSNLKPSKEVFSK